jgi:hypothetical protein
LGLHARLFTNCFLSRENVRPGNMIIVVIVVGLLPIRDSILF